jgi:hypothetical protein
MSVTLLSIQFNCGPSTNQQGAINLRVDQTRLVSLPEWQAGTSVNPEDSPAAYVLSAVGGQTITLQATLSSTAPEAPVVQVRAITPAPEQLPAPMFMRFLAPLRPRGSPPPRAQDLSREFNQHYHAMRQQIAQGNVLGESEPTMVSFGPDGSSGPVSIPLPTPQLTGVGRNVVVWLWQFRRGPNDPWIDLATTSHLIYTLLDPATLPWSQAPFDAGNLQIPWSTLLDFACSWAAGATTPGQAAALITQTVFGLGSSLITYDCQTGGSSYYTTPGMNDFNAVEFLELLNGGVGMGPRVDCTDCATFVSTFANALGCDLWQSRMGMTASGFAINPILAIGSDIWQTACGWGEFMYHEVAWTGDCGATDQVYDACLEVDGDNDPTTAPHQPLLPVDMTFGTSGSGDYLDRLASPAGRPNCIPRPATRIRRVLAAASPVPNAAVSDDLLAQVKRRHSFSEWAGLTTMPGGLFISRFTFGGGELTGWRPVKLYLGQSPGPATGAPSLQAAARVSPVGAAPPRRVLQTLWSQGTGDQVLLRVDSYEHDSLAAAHEFLVRVLADFQGPLVRRLPHEGAGAVGDVAFGTPNGAACVFARANHVHLVRSAGRLHVQVADAARELDARLTRRPPTFPVDAGANMTLRTGGAALLHSDVGPEPPGQWYKVFYSDGAVAREPAGLVYHAMAPGFKNVTMYTENAYDLSHPASAHLVRVAVSQ